jgi:hypothetical protein
MDGLTVDGTASFNYNGNENLFLADTANTSRSSFQVSGTANYFNANIDSASHGYYVWRSSNAYTERMRIDASGNVGIGTSSPSGELHVKSASSNANFYLQRSVYDPWRLSAGSGYLAFLEDSSEKMRIDSSGNVGIGTSSPAIGGGRTYDVALTIDGGVSGGVEDTGALEVGGSTSVNDRLVGSISYFNRDNSGAGATTRRQVAIIEARSVTSDSNAGDDSGANLTFSTKSEGGSVAERMRIDSSGNLLVGKTSTAVTTGCDMRPTGNIVASASADNPLYLNRSTNDGDIAVFAKDGTTVGSIGTNTGGLYIADAGVGFRFDSGGTDDIIPCNASGAAADASINLGSSGARFKDLFLSGTANASYGTFLSGVASESIQLTLGYSAGNMWTLGRENAVTGDLLFKNSGTSEKMRLTASGNLLVGTTSTADTDVGGKIFSDGRMVQGIAGVGLADMHDFYRGTAGSLTRVGNIRTNGSSTTYNTSSDQRLKDNIVDAPSASDDIDAIQVRSFDWKADGSHQKYGMVAQELNTVAPEAVSGDADSEDMMGVDYSKLVPMLIKEIQSLRNRVAQLEE